jgi:RNase H-like domain found in reverse transcriptase
MGFRLTANGLMLTDVRVKAINEMLASKDKQSVQRVLGAATFVARFLPNFSEITKCLRNLKHKDVDFVWIDDVHGAAFRKIQEMLTSAEVLQYYNAKKPIQFEVDSSINGCGTVLLQDNKPVVYASCSFTETESRLLSTIEREATAALYACEKFNAWTFGNSFEIEIVNDHKPLISISKKPLHNAPLRLQRIFLRLSRYNARFSFKPGRLMYVSDRLSRASLPNKLDCIV